MNKEQQDKAWTCLPKETREQLRGILNDNFYTNEKWLLYSVFGCHNLTSDTEPEEILMVERKKVQGIFHQIKLELGDGGCSEYQDDINMEKEDLLKYLFGDKCMPDTLIPPKSGELKNEIVDNKSAPKFGIGKEKTITFISKLSLGDRLYYNNPDGDSNYEIFEIEIAALKVRITSKGVNEIIYECKTPFQDYHVTILGDSDWRVYKDLQEVADYKNTCHPSTIKLLDGSTLIACVDVGIKDKIEGERKVIIPCQLSKMERLNSKRSLH